MPHQSRDAKDERQGHTKLNLSLCIGLGKMREDKGFFSGEGVFHALKLPRAHKLFVAMCSVKTEAIPFAIVIGFLSSIGGGIAATVFDKLPTPFPRLRFKGTKQHIKGPEMVRTQSRSNKSQVLSAEPLLAELWKPEVW